MRSATGLLAVPFLALVASADTPKSPPAPDPQKLSDRATLLAPIQVDSLVLTPIVAIASSAPKQDLDVLTLDEAFAQKQVSIREKEDESVNALTLTNKSSQPLFMLAGEVIIGGKQDRIIGANTVIPAKSTQAVPVYCVEHGRWQGETTEFTSGKALAHGRLRGRASYGQQGEVWAEVSAKNEKRKTSNPTDTYRKVATQQADGSLFTKQEKSVNEALAKLPAADRGRMIGYVVSLNGKVATVDMFTSPKLFTKLEPKLVRSYLTEAIDVVAQKDAKPPSAKDVKQFMADAEKAKEERTYENAYSGTTVQKGGNADRARVMLKTAPKPGSKEPADARALSDTVYENYQLH